MLCRHSAIELGEYAYAEEYQSFPEQLDRQALDGPILQQTVTKIFISIGNSIFQCGTAARCRRSSLLLAGPLPAAFGTLNKMVILDISRNNLTGGLSRICGAGS